MVVIGGGIAGTTAAISSARLGLKVALIQDRPVLGGNNSSEVRVHLGGRIKVEPFPALGDVVKEIGPSRGGNAQPAEQYEDETGEEIDFDLVAICCDFTEYESFEEIQVHYPQIKDMDDLRDNTQVIEFDGGIIIQDF